MPLPEFSASGFSIYWETALRNSMSLREMDSEILVKDPSISKKEGN
jgi:hypothetical protein